MITLKFPALHKALLKDTKELNENHIKKGIYVYSQRAFIMNEGIVLCYDLYEYFTLECGIEDPEEVKELKILLMFMEGKVYSFDFWAELTKGADMEIDGDKINISNPKYSKELVYKDFKTDVYPLISLLSKYVEFKGYETEEIAIPFRYFKIINDISPADLKNDSIMFHFKSGDGIMMFTFHKRKYICGLITPHYDPITESFKYDLLHDIAADFLEIEPFYKPQLPAPPNTLTE